MDLASTLRGLQSPEDLKRLIETLETPEGAWTPKQGVESLRLGQELLRRYLYNTVSRQVFPQLPTGYGKTLAAELTFCVLREKGDVTHLLIVCPTDEQRTSWLENTDNELEELAGFRLGVVDAGEERAITYFKRDQARIFVTTIHSLIQRSGKAIADELLSRGSWMLLVDEAQNYPSAQVTPFVTTIRSLTTKPSVNFVMPMTATATRSDKTWTVFGEPDLIVTPKVAVEEGAIRYVRTYLGEYDLDITIGDDPVPIRLSTTDISQQLQDKKLTSVREWELRCRVRYHSKYVSRLLLDALDRYYKKNSEYPGRHQIIIFAMTVAHAKHLADVMNKLAAPDVSEEEPLRFADYIGDTARTIELDDTVVTNDAYRPEEENKSVLKAFKSRQLPCLVQVAKAGVGFNHRYCSILVFLNNIGETVMLEQGVGRGLRRDMAIPKGRDILDILAGSDHPGAAFLKDLESSMPDPEDDDPLGGCGGGGWEGIISFPAWCLIDVQHREVKIFTPYGVFDAANPEDVARASSIASEKLNLDDSQVYQAVRQLFEEKKAEAKPMAHKQALEQADMLVRAATGTVISNAIRLRKRNGQTVESSLRGDLKRAINRQWRFIFGRGHAQMVEADFKQKFMWLEQVNTDVVAGNPPRWINL